MVEFNEQICNELLFKFQVNRIKTDKFRNLADAFFFTFRPMLTSKTISGWFQWADLQILFKFLGERSSSFNGGAAVQYRSYPLSGSRAIKSNVFPSQWSLHTPFLSNYLRLNWHADPFTCSRILAECSSIVSTIDRSSKRMANIRFAQEFPLSQTIS